MMFGFSLAFDEVARVKSELIRRSRWDAFFIYYMMVTVEGDFLRDGLVFRCIVGFTRLLDGYAISDRVYSLCGILQKRFAENDMLHQSLDTKIVVDCFFDDSTDGGGVGDIDLACQSVGEHVLGEASGEAFFFGEKSVFEFEDVLKGMLSKKYALRIDASTILVVVAPEAGRSVVFEGESERIDPTVTSGAFRLAAVGFEALA